VKASRNVAREGDRGAIAQAKGRGIERTIRDDMREPVGRGVPIAAPWVWLPGFLAAVHASGGEQKQERHSG
jgi:hypothetical protein